MQEGLDALPDVIRHIETYDVTSIRASTPMYLMARRIKAMGVKMVLSGEGADEIFGGYLYFHKAPSAEAFHEETVRKLDALHLYDCLRANKSMAAWGVEARVPFLDLEFLDVAMSMDAEHKRTRPGKIEKAVLREAFVGALPDSILWRQKEQFSDGVGYSWIDSLKAHAERTISDAELVQGGEGISVQHAGHEGGAAVSPPVRAGLPGRELRAHRAGRSVDRLLDADGDCLGCVVRGGRRSIRPRDCRSARRRASL